MSPEQGTLRDRPPISVRTRVIAAVMLLTAVALTLSGIAIYTRGQSITEARVAEDLHRSVDELYVLAEQGVNPSTGEAFATSADLLRIAMQRTILAPSEGAFAITDGEVRWTAPDGVVLRPEDDPELVAHVKSLVMKDEVSSGGIETASHNWRYVVIPVRFTVAETADDALVRATDLKVEGAVLNAIHTTYALVAIGSLALVGLLIWVFVGRLLQPVSEMSETAAHITETDLSERIPVRGHDDLSALATTINGMLDRLQIAVDGQRRLLDDVGHELRTPLTIVRGHLELMDNGDATDVETTRELVVDELDRMRRLVDDLLTLAKAEQPDFLHPKLTDIARLTDETLAKATGLGDRYWSLGNLADIKAVLDPQRIAQAWLQLAANAVQYSKEGSSISMGSQATRKDL